MTEKKKIQKEEDAIRRMMQSAKIEMPENLKHRILHQIETEKALTPQQQKKEASPRDGLADFRGIFGVMYGLLFALSVLTILFNGKEAIQTPQFTLTALLIVLTLSSFWALTRLDAYLRKRKKTK